MDLQTYIIAAFAKGKPRTTAEICESFQRETERVIDAHTMANHLRFLERNGVIENGGQVGNDTIWDPVAPRPVFKSVRTETAFVPADM